MKKLLKFKEWVSLQDAIRFIREQTGEAISLADIYELAINRHLSLSVYFYDYAFAYRGYLLDASLNLKSDETRCPDGLEATCDDCYDGDYSLNEMLELSECERVAWSYKVYRISGIWDILTRGAFKPSFKTRYNNYLNPDRDNELIFFDSISLARNGHYAQPVMRIDPSEGYYRSNCIACCDIWDDATLGIRPEELERFVASYNGDDSGDKVGSQSKPLHPKTRNTYLKLIATLAKDANYDLKLDGIAVSIEAATERMGHKVTDDTIRKVIKEVEDLIG